MSNKPNVTQEMDYTRMQLLVFNYISPCDLPPCAVAKAPLEVNDEAIINRIIQFYQAIAKKYNGAANAFWDNWTISIKKAIHDTLLSGSKTEIANILRVPSSNQLFLGFDNIWEDMLLDREWVNFYKSWIYDELVTIAVIFGIVRAYYPEKNFPFYTKYQYYPETVDIDEVLDKIATRLGFNLSFPNPYPDEQGLQSKRGIVSQRALQALYQAWKIQSIIDKCPQGENKRVLEIGAGLGRTAYYAYQMGITDYTIIDIPMTNVAQAYFLGRTLGENHVLLEGERSADSNQCVKILSPNALDKLEGRYCLVFNADSLTEMDDESRQRYWTWMKAHGDRFLSINHENNEHTVRELYENENVTAERRVYPMRRGYMEEEITFPHEVTSLNVFQKLLNKLTKA